MEKNVWIRLAVKGPSIRQGSPYGWRCFIEGSLDEISLKSWRIVNGGVIQDNIVGDFNANEDKRGLIAWIDFYGSYSIKDDVMHIELADPKDNDKAPQ